VRIVFIHRTAIDYTVETPYRQALGGTEASLSYLSVELAKLGHSVVFVANTSQPGRYLGVECLNYKTALTKDFFDGADAVVVVNEALGSKLRELGLTKPLVMWVGHADDQASIEALEFTRERKAWTGFAFVSQWQLEQYVQAYWVPRERARVMRNAIAPAFAVRRAAEPWFQRGEAPTLVYTSAPYRGLDVLLAAFPAIRAAIPGVRLRVFAGLSKTRGGPDDNQYADLHRRCLGTDGVDYVGPVSQPTLADALADAAALAYPSTFPETSCIAAMEAMAMGAMILTTNLGALPETLAGFGRMVAYRDNPAVLAGEFAAMAIDALNDILRNPDQATERRNAQVTFVQQNYAWPARALEWQTWLSNMIAEQVMNGFDPHRL
jgi:glycosyltransferase involved in cell wall biosynthesis